MKTTRPFCFSFLLHSILFFILIFHLQQKESGKNAVKTVDAYVPQMKQAALQHHIEKKLKLTEKDKQIIPEKLHTEQAASVAVPAQKMLLAQGVHDQLLEELHEAIAKEQHYPAEAQALGQSGMVRVGFMLDPAGRLTDIRVVSSSGIQSLDVAALDSVRGIQPFFGAKGKLDAPDFFSVEVYFHG